MTLPDATAMLQPRARDETSSMRSPATATSTRTWSPQIGFWTDASAVGCASGARLRGFR